MFTGQGAGGKRGRSAQKPRVGWFGRSTASRAGTSIGPFTVPRVPQQPVPPTTDSYDSRQPPRDAWQDAQIPLSVTFGNKDLISSERLVEKNGRAPSAN